MAYSSPQAYFWDNMELKYFRYRFPFVQPFRTSGHTLKFRKGIIIQLQKNGITAYGEAAPLPDRSFENLSQVINQLKTHISEISRLFRNVVAPGDLDEFYNRFNIAPSLRFALDTLAFSYSTQADGDYTLFEKPLTRVAVNTVIPIRTEAETLQAALQAKQEGFNTFKLKVGQNFGRELALLKKLRYQFPNIKLRIDANRAWKPDEALNNLKEMEETGIEYCEEPISQPTLSTLKELTAQSPVPLALDETLTNINIVHKAASFIPVLVLKPMIMGSFSDLFATKRLVDSHEHKMVFTTALESVIGRHMTAILSSGLGSHPIAHGLDTGRLLAVDIWHARSYIQKGYFSPSDTVVRVQKIQSDPKHIAEETFFSGE